MNITSYYGKEQDMPAPALLIEELAEATGFTRQTLRDAFDAIVETVSDQSSALRQRVRGIMASSASVESRYDAVMEVTNDNLDTHVKSRIMAALGLGFLGGFLLASAAAVIVELVGIVLILMAGYMLKDMLRIAMDRISQRIEDISVF
jgi:hypothetical protein